ncbi:hypothetical protein [Chitinophaga sp. sic0106]|nr:hypothetical protein [Chitinophaga sp. sic0106]
MLKQCQPIFGYRTAAILKDTTLLNVNVTVVTVTTVGTVTLH